MEVPELLCSLVLRLVVGLWFFGVGQRSSHAGREWGWVTHRLLQASLSHLDYATRLHRTARKLRLGKLNGVYLAVHWNVEAAIAKRQGMPQREREPLSAAQVGACAEGAIRRAEAIMANASLGLRGVFVLSDVGPNRT